MAATLERNGIGGKGTPSNVPPKEVIHCTSCETSYTLSLTDDEIRMVGSENNLDKMRRTAIELIKKEHPDHFRKFYLWKAIGAGPECCWEEADRLAARAKL